MRVTLKYKPGTVVMLKRFEGSKYVEREARIIAVRFCAYESGAEIREYEIMTVGPPYASYRVVDENEIIEPGKLPH